MRKYLVAAVIFAGLVQTNVAMAQYWGYRQPTQQYRPPPMQQPYIQPYAGATQMYPQQFSVPQYIPQYRAPMPSQYAPPQYIMPSAPATPMYPGTNVYYPPPQYYSPPPMYYFRW